MERACFDYIMIEDTLMISEAYGGNAKAYLKHAIMGPKHDPAPLAALLGANTQNMGVVATFSTMAYPPFMLARLCNTLDHICKGRFGWNIVTSGENLAAQNFGMDELPPRQDRYDMADEYVELVKQLWGSWDQDAVVLDRKTGTYADYTKVRPINFVGKYFKCRGPLNTAPSPQGRPAFVQAGGSPRGRQFAAITADSIIAPSAGIKGNKAYRDDVRARAETAGPRSRRDQGAVRGLAHPRRNRSRGARTSSPASSQAPYYIEKTLAGRSSTSDIDFSQVRSRQGAAAADHQWRAGLARCLRAMGQRQDAAPAGAWTTSRAASRAWSARPIRVADYMESVMDEVGGDGFLITKPQTTLVNRKYITEVCQGLVPALQRRGLARTEYTKSTLRETLREF